MTYHDYVSYAIYAAEQVIDIYEKEYPNDNRPRLAIKAAKSCINTKSNKCTALDAARAAEDADAALDAAEAAKAAWAADACKESMQLKILEYGFRLIE